MDEVRTALKRTHALLLVPDRPFERFLDRRDRVRSRQRRAALVVAAAIALTAVGGGTYLMTGLDRGGSWRSAGGWQPVRSLALRPGQSFYLRVESSDLGDGHVRDEETWWAADGSGQVRNRSTRQDKYAYPPTGTYDVGAFPTWLADVSSLSTDPEVLARQLREEPWDWGGGPEPTRRWGVITALLFESPDATPELRAALFEVASRIEGVTASEGGQDPVGRPALTLELSDVEHGARWSISFDPGTHQAMAWTYRSLRGGTIWQVLESGIVEATGRRPTADQWLTPPLPERAA